MKSLFLVLVLVLVLAVSVSAKTVRVSDYAIANDNLNDSAGFQTAVDILKANKGGTLEIGGGVWNLDSQINFSTAENYISYIVKGDGGSIIKLNLGQYGQAFYVGNATSFTMENLVIRGTSLTNADYDAGIVLVSSYTGKTTIRNVQFYGIKAFALVYIGKTDARIENCEFGGNSSDAGNIYGAFDLLGLSVENTNFTDYANFLGEYYSKSEHGNQAWIFVDKEAQGVGTYFGTRVHLVDLRLDEGAISAIEIKNVPSVRISGLQVNLNGTLNGAGIVLNNVKQALVADSAFGFTEYERPAIVLKNNTKATASRLSFGGGVFFTSTDATSLANISDCTECLIN